MCKAAAGLRSTFLAVILGSFFLALSYEVAAQSLSESLEINLSSVEVVVMDRSGAHVHGLTRDDFEVFDNGRLQTITNFTEYREGAEIDVVAGHANETRELTSPIVEKRPVLLLIFIDNAHMTLKTRQRASDAIRRFLQAQSDVALRVTIVTFDGHDTRQSFTGDGSSAAASLPSLLAAQPPHEMDWRTERRHCEELIEGEAAWYIALEYARKYADFARADAMRTIEALQQSAGALQGVSGRKLMLYVTEGIPESPGAEMLAFWSARFPSTGSRGHGFIPGSLEGFQFDLGRDLERLAKSANAAGVSMYTIDVRGTENDEFDIEAKTTGRLAAFGVNPKQREAQALRDTRHATLGLLADATGGTFIHNQNVFDEPLAAIAGDYRDYYSIGYRTPSGKSSAHRIEVRSRRSGLSVRSRRDYITSTPEERIAARVESLFAVAEADNPLALSIERGETSKAGGATRMVTITLRVPREKLTIVGSQARVTFYVEARDPSGGRTPLRSVARALPPSGDVVLPMRMTMRRGVNAIVVGARDDTGGALSLARLDVNLD